MDYKNMDYLVVINNRDSFIASIGIYIDEDDQDCLVEAQEIIESYLEEEGIDWTDLDVTNITNQKVVRL